MTGRRVAVTGASGFIGQHLCQTLAEAGDHVVAIGRNASRLPPNHAMVLAKGLTDRPALSRAFRGVDAVVHLAARVHVMREAARDPVGEFRHVNVDGTRIVCEEAVRAGVRRVVFVSSVKVLGDGQDQPYREADAPAPEDPYGTSKLEAEQTVAEVVRGSASWTILRPPLVYGPGVGGNFLRLLRLAGLARRVPLPLGAISNRRSMVGVRNLVSALFLCTRHVSAAGRAYLISDGEDLSTSDLIERLALALGGRARLLPCPVGVLRAVAGLFGLRAEVDRLTSSLTVDSSPIGRELGWTPPVSVQEEFGAVAEWWGTKGRRRA